MGKLKTLKFHIQNFQIRTDIDILIEFNASCAIIIGKRMQEASIASLQRNIDIDYPCINKPQSLPPHYPV